MSTVERNYNGVVVEKFWSLKDFVRENGEPYIQENINRETGEIFTSLSFPNAKEGRVFCHFGYSTDGMTKKDIQRKKDQLKVGLNSNGKYTLFIQEEKGERITLW